MADEAVSDDVRSERPVPVPGDRVFGNSDRRREHPRAGERFGVAGIERKDVVSVAPEIPAQSRELAHVRRQTEQSGAARQAEDDLAVPGTDYLRWRPGQEHVSRNT